MSTTGSSMRARQWTIAARFRDPADYGIPPAPTFHAERDADGAVAFYGDDGRLVMRAGDPMTVRR